MLRFIFGCAAIVFFGIGSHLKNDSAQTHLFYYLFRRGQSTGVVLVPISQGIRCISAATESGREKRRAFRDQRTRWAKRRIIPPASRFGSFSPIPAMLFRAFPQWHESY